MRFLLLYVLFFIAFASFGQVERAIDTEKKLLLAKISITAEELSISAIIEEISHNYQIPFTYINEAIPLDRKVTVLAEDTPLFKLLDFIFKGTSVKYHEIGTHIVLVSDLGNMPAAIVKHDTIISETSGTDKTKSTERVQINGGRINAGKKGSRRSYVQQAYDSIARDTISVTTKTKKKVDYNLPRSFYKIEYAITASFSEELTYRSLRPKSYSGNYIVYDRDGSERPTLKPSFTVTFSRDIGRRGILNTGFTFAQMGEEGVQRSYYWSDNVEPTEKNYSNSFKLIGIPLSVGYKIIDQRISAIISGGLAFLKLTQTSSSFAYYDYRYIQKRMSPEFEIRLRDKLNLAETVANPYPWNKDRDDTLVEYNNFLVSITADFNIQYRLSKRWGLLAGPSFRYIITSIYKNNAPIKQYPYSFGLNGAVRVYL